MIKKSVEAAVAQQKAYTILNKAVTDVGASHEVAGQQIQSVIEKQATLKGFSTTDIAAGFTHLVSDTKNSAEAFKLLQVAEDAARASGEPLATAAAQVGKAYEGSTGALRSFGIVVTPVKTAIEQLAATHVQASVALQTVAAQQDKVLTGQEAIAELEARVGGQSALFAKTAAGQWDIFRVAVSGLEVTIGNQLLPVLDAAATRLGTWANDLATSTRFQHDARDAGRELVAVFHDIESTVETVGPILVTVAKDAAAVTSAIGAPALLAVAGTLTAVAVGYKTVGAAQALYAAALKANAGAEGAVLSETAAHTAALTANTAALGDQAVAAHAASGSIGQLAAAYAAVDSEAAAFEALTASQAAEMTLLIGELEAYTVALDEVAASEVAAATAAGGFDLAGLAGGLFALAGGPAGLAVVGVAALAGGIAYLATQADASQHALSGFEGSVNNLNNAFSSSQADQFSVEQDKITVAEDKAALATTKLGTGTAQYHQLVLNLREAVAQLNTDEQKLSGILTTQTGDLATVTTKLQGYADALKTANQVGFTGRESEGFLNAAKVQAAAQAVTQFVTALDKDAAANQKLNPLLAAHEQLLGEIATATGKIPTDVEIKLLINNTDPIAELTQILALSGQLGSTLTNPALLQGGSNEPQPGTLPPVGHVLTSIQEQAASAAFKDVTSGNTHAILTAAARATITTLEQAIAADTADQALLDQQMADTVQQGALAVRSAVNQAKQNFVTIGSDIATSIGTYIDTPLTLAGNALQLQSDQIGLQYVTLTNQLALSSDVLTTKQAAISLAQQAINAKFAQQSATLTEEQDRISVRSANLAYENARRSIIIGGQPLSTNYAEASRELKAYLRRAPASVQPIIQSEIDAFTTTHIAAAQARIQLAEHIPPAQAARAAGLTTQADRNAVIGDQLKFRDDTQTFSEQRRRDALTVETDIATIEKRAAQDRINNWSVERLKKTITLKQYNQDIAGLVKADIGNLSNIAKIPGGLLLEEQLRLQIAAISKQDLAIGAVPQAGTGLGPSIDHPLTTLQQSQIAIADIAKSQRADALTKLQDQTKISNDILNVLKSPPSGYTRSSLARNPGEQSRLLKQLTGVPG